MIKNQKISSRQAFFLIASLSIGTNIIIFTDIFKLAGRESGIAQITSQLLVIPLALWTLRIGQSAPGLTILEILEMTAGKIVGRVACGVYAVISVAVMTLVTKYYIGVLQAFSLPNTPLWVTSFVFLILTTTIARTGIEVVGRLCEILFIVVHIIYFLGISPAFLDINTDLIFPVFERGVADFATGSYLLAGGFSESVLFLFIMVAALPRPTNNYWTVSKALLFEAAIFATASIVILGIYGVEIASHLPFSPIQVALDLQKGKFLQGLEVFVQVDYILGAILCVTGHTYAASVATAKIFNNRLPMVWLVMVSTSVAIMLNFIPSLNENIFYATLLGRYATLPFITLVLLIISAGLILRGRKTKGHRQ